MICSNIIYVKGNVNVWIFQCLALNTFWVVLNPVGLGAFLKIALVNFDKVHNLWYYVYVKENLNIIKKGNIQFWFVECLPKLKLCGHLSHRLKCHFFITATNKDRSDKMIAMYLRTFIIKILLFIITKPPFFYKIRGRHSTTDVS